MTWLDPIKRRDAARANSRKRLKAHQEFLATLKLERGCVDCGYNDHPAALEFDHREPDKKLVTSTGKRMTVSSMSTWPRAKVLAEIEKCDVRCANCHAIRTTKEGHWAKRVEDRDGRGDSGIWPELPWGSSGRAEAG